MNLPPESQPDAPDEAVTPATDTATPKPARKRRAVAKSAEAEAGDDVERADFGIGSLELPRQCFEIAHRRIGRTGAGWRLSTYRYLSRR